MHQAEIIPISAVIRKDLPSADAEAHFHGFCKALLTLKLFLKSSPAEIVVGVQNLFVAQLLTKEEVHTLAEFYGWELGA